MATASIAGAQGAEVVSPFLSAPRIVPDRNSNGGTQLGENDGVKGGRELGIHGKLRHGLDGVFREIDVCDPSKELSSGSHERSILLVVRRDRRVTSLNHCAVCESLETRSFYERNGVRKKGVVSELFDNAHKPQNWIRDVGGGRRAGEASGVDNIGPMNQRLEPAELEIGFACQVFRKQTRARARLGVVDEVPG